MVLVAGTLWCQDTAQGGAHWESDISAKARSMGLACPADSSVLES